MDDQNNPSTIDGFRLPEDQFDLLVERIAERVAPTAPPPPPPPGPSSMQAGDEYADNPILQAMVRQAAEQVQSQFAPQFETLARGQRPLLEATATEMARNEIGANYFTPIESAFKESLRSLPDGVMKDFVENGGAKLIAQSLAFEAITQGKMHLGYDQANSPTPFAMPPRAERIEDLPAATRQSIAEMERVMGRAATVDELRELGVFDR